MLGCICHARVYKWLFHLGAREASGWWSVSFLDPQLDVEICSTAEVTRGNYAYVHAVVCGLKLADPGITTEPRGRTASQSRPVDIFTTAAVPVAVVCVASSIAAAARGDAGLAAFDRKLLHYSNEIWELRQQGIHYRPLIWTARTLPPVGTGSRCRRTHFIAGGHMKSKSLSCSGELPRHVQFCLIFGREESGSLLVLLIERCITGDTSPLLMVDPSTPTMPTPRLTQRCLTTTLPLSPVIRLSLCSHQVSNCLVCPHMGGGCFRSATALPRDRVDQPSYLAFLATILDHSWKMITL